MLGLLPPPSLLLIYIKMHMLDVVYLLIQSDEIQILLSAYEDRYTDLKL